MAARPSFFHLAPQQVGEWLRNEGQPDFRRGQVLQWVYRRFAPGFEAMTDLPRDLRQRLAAAFVLGSAVQTDSQTSRDGRTSKRLLRFPDDAEVECVLMRDRDRTSVCLSSQAGCAMACRFCATGSAGFHRNLTGAEIVEQAWALGQEGPGFTHVVFMGMGEPLRNLAAVVQAMQSLTDADRFGVGARRVTLSTCGIPSGIQELAHAAVAPHLALSIGSPFEEERVRLMPGTRRHPLDKVLEAATRYARSTGRHLTLEYVLLRGVNDSRPHARALAKLAKTLPARVNLIPFNPVEGAPFQPPSTEETARFREWIEVNQAPVSVRFRRGRDILAGCGQLRGGRASSPAANP
jgi:23S rRNA (adenine2503-C2)-methyltransferase